ncbi:NAD+ synthase [Lysobacter sp. A03]|uniref:NAD+ synthase n=1 Tax=Lysobacter sp. A03 TaxID=1199154 RepID=UPI0005B72D86|nr:NAD+ synthase [Lysobacter sp. A03]KIQ96916.1 NAD synthetase [Lysobacter sp. A03]
MTQSLRIALAQFDFAVGAVDENADLIVELIEQARDDHGADLVLFPELAVSGYPPQDLLMRPGFLRACEGAMERIAAAATGITVVVGWPESVGSVVYNAASILRDGRIEQTYRKRKLPNHAGFDERRYFVVDPDVGDCVFEIDGVRLGLLIGEDVLFQEPIASTVAAGAQLVLSINASPFEHDLHGRRDQVLEDAARANAVPIAYVNCVGGQDSVVFDGACLVADGDGCVHPAASAFTEQWLVVDFEPTSKRFHPVLWQQDGDESRDALAWRAVVTATRDYYRKNGFQKAWVGLSGGLDSAVVLAIAVDALGADNVTAVRMPSRYTVSLSNDLAAEQCEEQGVELLSVPIEKPFQGYLDALEGVFEGQAVDTTEENLQSRIRGAILMALSNKFGGLVLTTGNKSEYAVGYSTIYGDMAGGFAPIKDLYKSEVFQLARWRNTVGDPVVPVGVIERPPSAELRADQKDEDSLPPYDVLDAILRRTIDQEQSRDEVVRAGFDAATVDRVLHLIRISEWKRHQAAPGPKLSRRAFGGERRYPISNGFRE